MARPSPPADPPDVVELCVRSLAPAAVRRRQQQVRDRLRDLADRDILDLDVTVWGERVPLDEPAPTAGDTDVHERVEALRSWAADNGRTLAPTVERRTCHSSLTGERYEFLALPVMVLAEYRDGSLAHVAPSRRGDEVVTLVDRLSTLEAAVESPQVA